MPEDKSTNSDMYDDEDEDEDEEEEEEEEGAEKSVGLDDLLKSLDALDAVTSEASTDTDREGYLRARFEAGTITKSEQAALGAIWSGSAEEDDGEDLVKSLRDNDVIEQTIDASDFLKSLVGDVQTSLDGLASMVKSEAGGARRVAVESARAIVGIGRVVGSQNEIIKALGARLERVEGTPSRRRSATTPRGITKSRDLRGRPAAGDDIGGQELLKSEIDTGIMRLTVQADEAGDQGALNKLSNAAALYSQGFGLPKPVSDAILALRN